MSHRICINNNKHENQSNSYQRETLLFILPIAFSNNSHVPSCKNSFLCFEKLSFFFSSTCTFTYAPTYQQQKNVSRPSFSVHGVSRSDTRSIMERPLSRPTRRIEYFATCAKGLSEVLRTELESPVISRPQQEVQILSTALTGVKFSANSLETGYRATFWSRCATRVLIKIKDVPLTDSYRNPLDDLYFVVKKSVDWPRYIAEGQTFTTEVRMSDMSYYQLGRDSKTFGENSAQVRIKDAICDSIRDFGQEKPQKPFSNADADLGLFVTIHDGLVTIYMDLGGPVSLHKRGWRTQGLEEDLELSSDATDPANDDDHHHHYYNDHRDHRHHQHRTSSDIVKIHKASLNESVAAGILYLSGFSPDGVYRPASNQNGTAAAAAPTTPAFTQLLDPMCGSGTILVEAALLARRIAPGVFRKSFGFEKWPNFDRRLFQSIVQEAESMELSSCPFELRGNDVHPGAVALCKQNILAAGLDQDIEIDNKDVLDYYPRKRPQLIFSNPPWGERLEDADSSWMLLGRFLKDACPGATAYLLSGNPNTTRELRMKVSQKYPIRVGNIDCRLLKYQVLHPKPVPSQALNPQA